MRERMGKRILQKLVTLLVSLPLLMGMLMVPVGAETLTEDEYIGWYAPITGDPVCRLYNLNAGDHPHIENNS